MSFPFNATCGDVASWRNGETDWKQAFAKFINFLSLNYLGGHKKTLGGTAPEFPFPAWLQAWEAVVVA